MANKTYLDKNGLSYFWGKIKSALTGKQDTLVSGTNIKTINNTSLLGNGNISISGATINDSYNTSVDEAYSCNYINNIVKDVYSTTEIDTGKTWIDGKKIYRKEITLTDHPTTTSPFTKQLPLENIENIWLDKTHSTWVSTSSGISFQFNYFDGTTYVESYFTINNGIPTFNLRHNGNIWNIYLVIEYTKSS